MLLKLSKILLMNLTEEENITEENLIDTGFARYLFVPRYWFEQVGSLTFETAEECMLFHINWFSATF